VRGAIRDGAGCLVRARPFGLRSLLTGLSVIGHDVGLFRRYWVLFKLLLTIFATIVC